jgi:hypothetical protein
VLSLVVRKVLRMRDNLGQGFIFILSNRMKPKINGRIVAVFFLLCLTVFVGSCIVEESFFENDSSMDQALVMEAEEWYRENLLPLPTDNARTRRSNSLIDGNPLWNKAKTLQHKGRTSNRNSSENESK